MKLHTSELFALVLVAGAVPAQTMAEASDAFIPRLVNSSTIPANGDVNPYGVAFVPNGFPAGGAIAAGDVLVSNFNNGANIQGMGTTIVQLTPSGPLAPPGTALTFFTSTLPGLSTALGVLQGGFVLVGNVSTADGTFGTIGQGAVQVVDRLGNVVQTWTDPTVLDGPWDLAIDDQGTQAHVFVSNVLNGTVARLDVAVASNGVTLLKKTTIAAGYTHVPNAAALVLGPTGLAYDANTDTLYVASTADNAIYAISNAAQRTSAVVQGNVVFAGTQLRGPLALRFAPNGNLLTANGDAVNADLFHPSEIVEFTKSGQFVREYSVDSSQGGAFGIDTVQDNSAAFNYAAIDDVTSNLSVYLLPGRIPPSTTRLVNISSRANVGNGGNVSITGFVIAGNTAETVLIRGVGPSLSQFGITGVLAAPRLTFYDSNGVAIATNIGWGTDPTLGTSPALSIVQAATASVMSSVGAFALPAGSADCAMLVTLPPGAYTAQVNGANSTSGIALVEIYEVP